MRLAEPISDHDLDFLLQDAIDAGSPDAIIEWLRAAIDDPARRADDFSVARAMVVICELQQQFDRTAEAEATLRAAVAADLHHSHVDPALAERAGVPLMQHRMRGAVRRVREGDRRDEDLASVLFWPKADHEQAIARWPELTDRLGSSWDAHRANTELALARFAEQGLETAFTGSHPSD